ncbi:MAG: hypothetical protein CM15mP112_05720 [Flavobacteriales bacterium]|nr:MAG: hypothetical protein CM15mP112_05720 [Flavobacteriales bacterium]
MDYSSITSCQSNCVVPSWDCDGQGNCYDPGTGNGLYGSLTVCQSNCVVPSWDCDGQGNCYDPGLVMEHIAHCLHVSQIV